MNTRAQRLAALNEALATRILVLDGAMGTMIQQHKFTEAQFRACGTLNGTKDIAKPPADTADKATIVAALKASYDECDKAYGALTDTNITETLTLGQNKRSRRVCGDATIFNGDGSIRSGCTA